MPKDSRKKLYDAVSSKYDIGTFDEFNNKMDDSASRKKFYESVSKDFDLGDFSSFENKISLKKKEASLPKLGNQFAAIGKSGLLEKQVSEVPAPFVGAAGKKEYQRQEEEAIKAKKSMSDRLQKAQDVYFQSQGVNELLGSFENIQGRLKDVDVSLATNYKDDYSGARTVSASDDLTRYNQEKSNLLNERNRLSDFSNNAISSVSPYIDSEISSAIKGDNLGRFVRTVSGDVVPDEFKVDAFAKSFATKHGLKDDGYVKKLVYNKLKSKIAYEIDKPAIDKDFEKLFKSKYGVSPDQAAKNEYISMFKAGKAIDYELSNQAKALGEEMKSEIKSEVQVIESEYAPVIKNIKDEYESQISYLKADGDRLNQMYQSGQISESEYSGAINGLNSKINSINNTSKEKFEKIANEMLVRQNELSGKYDRKYKRQITELTESAKAKMSEAASKFGKSFKISKELQDKYESTWKEASSKYLAKKEAVRYGLDQVESMYFGQFAKNLLMGAGGALKTLSFMGDFDAGYVLGDYIENSFRSSSPELKSAMDLLSPTKLQASAGRMIGGMAPIIATGAAAAAVTKNAPAAVRLATTGLANYLVETSQIGGAIKEDVFAKTGSMAKAETAAKKAMDANVALLPLYAFEGLPFISDIQLGIKNMFLRSAAKAGIEFATELPQEYFQGVFEDIAKVGGDINVSSVGKEMTMDRLKNTALNIAPTTLITGGLPTFAKASSMEISKMQGKSYAAKIDMANLTPTAQQQFLFDLSLRKSNTFTKAVVSSLFNSGYISEEQMKKMESAIDQSQTIKQEAKKLGLTESQSKVYAALKFNYIQAKSEFDTTSDEGSKAVAKSNMSNALKAMNDYMNGKNPEAAVVYLANNEQYVYSFETINSLLNEKGDFYNQVMNGDINIGLLSDETNPKAIQLSNNILNLLKEKVEQDAIQKQTASEVPVQPEARVGEEVAAGEPQAEPQTVAEGVEEEVTLPSQTVEAPSITKGKIKYNPVEQVAVHQETGGSTYRVTGENLVGKPAASVSIFPERTKVSKKKVTSAMLKKFAKENADILDGNEDVLAVGTWFNSETGENMIDIVAALPKKEATRLGRDYNQIAVFDLENMEEIPTGGTGEMVEGLKPEVERINDIRNILGQQAAPAVEIAEGVTSEPTKPSVEARKNVSKKADLSEKEAESNDIANKIRSLKISEDGKFTPVRNKNGQIVGPADKKTFKQVSINNSEQVASMHYLKNILDLLASKFNAKYVFINDPNSNNKGWVEYTGDFLTSTIYINSAKATPDTPIHEYAHLFLLMIKAENKELYANLLREINKSDEAQAVLEDVKRRYPNDTREQHIDETIVELIGRYGAKQLDTKSGIHKYIKQVWDTFVDFLERSFNIKIYDINPNSSIEMVAKLLVNPNTQFDFSSITEETLDKIKSQAELDISVNEAKLEMLDKMQNPVLINHTPEMYLIAEKSELDKLQSDLNRIRDAYIRLIDNGQLLYEITKIKDIVESKLKEYDNSWSELYDDEYFWDRLAYEFSDVNDLLALDTLNNSFRKIFMTKHYDASAQSFDSPDVISSILNRDISYPVSYSFRKELGINALSDLSNVFGTYYGEELIKKISPDFPYIELKSGLIMDNIETARGLIEMYIDSAKSDIDNPRESAMFGNRQKVIKFEDGDEYIISGKLFAHGDGTGLYVSFTSSKTGMDINNKVFRMTDVRKAISELFPDIDYDVIKFTPLEEGSDVRKGRNQRAGIYNIYARKLFGEEAVNVEDNFGTLIAVPELFKAKINTPQIFEQRDYSDVKTGITFFFDKNTEKFDRLKKAGYVTTDKTMKDFDGKYIVFHKPDYASTVNIVKNGVLLYEGQGGMYYPIKFHEDGLVWAASSERAAKAFVKLINESARLSADGIGRIALVSTPSDKVLSSYNASAGIVDILVSKVFDSKFGLSESAVKKSLVESANAELGLSLSDSQSLQDVADAIKEKLKPENIGSIKNRRLFIVGGKNNLLTAIANNVNESKNVSDLIDFFGEGLLNEGYVGSRTGKLSKVNLAQAFSYMFNEPSLRDIEQSDITYAVIEVPASRDGGDVVTFEKNKSHKSYPFAIKVVDKNAKTRLNILSQTSLWNNVTIDPATGGNIERSRMPNILDTMSGVSNAPLLVSGKIKELINKRLPSVANAKEAAKSVRKLKIKTAGTLQSNIAGLPMALYNSVIEFIATSIEAGASVAEAISNAVEKYKLRDVQGFNENGLYSALSAATGIELPVPSYVKNAATDARRADYGLEPRTRPTKRSFSTVEDEAKAALKSGANPYELMDKANSGVILSDVEQAIIGLFIANKENELIVINEKIERMGDSSATEFASEVANKDKILDELLLAYDAVASTGTSAARALSYRRMRILQDYSLAGIISRKRKVKNNQPLTRSELAEAQKTYMNIKRAQEALDAKMQKLNEEQSKAKLKKTIPQIVNEIKLEERALKRKATKEEILAERKSIKDEISKILRKSRSELGANKIPFELIPALAKLAKNYIKEGVVNIDELVDKVHGDLSGLIDGLTKADVKRALSNYNKDNKETKEELQDKISKLNQANKKIEESEAASKKSKNAAKAGKSLDAEDYQNQADKLSEEAAQIAKSEGVDVSDKRLEAYKNRIKKRIAELKDRIARKDFSKVERDEIQLDAEAEKLKAELDKIKFDYEVELAKEELNNRNLIEKIGDSVVDVMGVPRALMATADYSAPLRQAVVATVAYPKIALEASKEMFKQSLLPAAADQWLSDLYASPGYQLMKDSGLYIADIKNPKLTAKEEDFTTNLAAKIPGLGMLVGESERAYVAYLNKMRVDIFSLGVEIMQNNGKSFATNPKDYKALAAYVNDITGRGELPSKIEGAGPFLNIMFFSPRLILSRFRLLTNWINPYWYFKTPLEVKKMYAKDMGLFIAFGSAVLLAFAASGADVEDDPRSSDFGKIRYGDTRWDIWGGFQQFVRAFAQATTGETKSTVSGKVRELKSEDRAGVIGRFFRSKLAPVPSLVVDAYTGKDMMGVPFNLKEKAISMSYPLVLQSGVESMQQDGVVFGIGATYLPSILGVGVQTYSTNDFLKQGPDDDIVKLLRDKRAVAIEPNNLDRKIYDIESGNDRKMSDAEFKKYYEVWANHVKTTLKENMGEYKSMSTERFEREFNKIKSQASSIAKESVIGFSSSMKTIRLTINGELETIELSAEDVKLRKQLNDEFKAKNMRIFDRAFNRAIRDNKTPYEAEILANKELEKAANEYSKDIILKMHKRGKTYDFE